MKRWLRIGAAVAAALGVAGFLVAVSGVVPIKASSGHWAVTYWVLEFGKRRSLATYTLGLDLPPLDEPWLVLKGAGHYHDGCRPCHGAPGLPTPRIPAAMTPEPPELVERIEIYDDEELFYIVKHGIKFTGMPAWPTQQRDDEVRAVVAFLRELPNLDAESYRELVEGEVTPQDEATPLAALTSLDPPAEVTSSCGRCHGITGHGRGNAAFPKLAGQKREYLFRALRAYASSARNSGIMEPIAASLSEEQWRTLADFYGALPGDPAAEGPESGSADLVARGREIATSGIPDKDVPSCTDCHGPEGPRRNDAYPLLAGQYADYLVLQLEQFAAQHRGGSEYAHLMRHVAPKLSRAEMEAVAAYYAQSTGAL